MKRRQAIRQLGFGVSTAFVGASWLSSCKKEDPIPEIQYNGNVIVIGGGISGLLAADILISKGVNVTVLEAGSVVGGRLSSLRNQENLQYQSIADFPVELGAEYFQGLDSPFGKLVANLGLTPMELTDESKRYIIDNQAKSATDWVGNADFEGVQAFMNNVKTYTGPATSMKDAAGGFGPLPLLNAQAGNFYGSTADRVGVKGISEQQKLSTHDQKIYVLKSHALQDLVFSRFAFIKDKVKVNSPVKSINYGADPIVVTLEDGTQYTANKVVVTVPVTILKEGITFTPALPAAKITALGRIGMDPSMRVVIDFKKNFWGVDSSLIWGSELAPQLFNIGLNRSDFTQTLSITIHGAKAKELSDLNDGDAIVTKILQELDKIYANQATPLIRKTIPDPTAVPPVVEKMIYFIKDWTKEKYIQGGFSYPYAAATLDDRMALIEPISDKLFLGGEATDVSGDPGTISGAMAAGERVAEDVVLAIKKVTS